MPDGVDVPRRIFRRSQEPLAADVSLIASEFLAAGCDKKQAAS